MNDIKDFKSFLNESNNFPDRYEGNDEIILVKTKETNRGANYVPYYRGYNIDIGGYTFKSVEALERFAKDYILSIQKYNKYRYKDVKPLPKV